MICKEEAFHLHNTNGKNTNSQKVLELKSSQKKTDTRVILYYMYAKQKGCKNICKRTPDSDILFICLHYTKTELQALNVFIDVGNSKNRRLIDVTGYASGLSTERCRQCTFGTAYFHVM